MDIKPRRADNAVMLEALRGLTDDVPSRESPLLDRLFALECSIRGGTATRTVTDELRVARREAEWRIADEWEPDVPHVAELGQAISTNVAAGSDPCQGWIEKLATTVERLVERRTKFNLDSDPLLLAAVIRGMGAAGQKLPARLVETTRTVLERRPPALAASEMAEALCRHHEHEALARDFAGAAFSSSTPLDAASASARWWLAERWIQIKKHSLPQDPEQIRESRLVVLSTTLRNNARASAMALEAVGRSVDRLIVDTPDNLESAQSATRRRRITELYFWRAGVAMGVALVVIFNLDPIVGRIDAATGVVKPTALVFQAIFGLGCAVIAFTLITLLLGLAKLHKGLDMPKVERAAEIFIPLAAGLVGAILHQG